MGFLKNKLRDRLVMRAVNTYWDEVSRLQALGYPRTLDAVGVVELHGLAEDVMRQKVFFDRPLWEFMDFDEAMEVGQRFLIRTAERFGVTENELMVWALDQQARQAEERARDDDESGDELPPL